MIRIEVQDTNGNWRQTCTCMYSSQVIRRRMDEAAKKYKGFRVRALDSQSRVVDIL